MAQISLEGSRLVRFLNNLDVSNAELFNKDFAERISQLIGLHKSLALSGLPLQMARLRYEPRSVNAEAVQQECLRVNQELMESLIASFSPGSGSARVQFPGTREDASEEQLQSFELYVQFYNARQRQIEQKLQHLLSYVRDAAAGFSPRLAQLVMLETSLGEAIAGYDRQCFASVPKLLQGHFEELRQEHNEQQSPSEQRQIDLNDTEATINVAPQWAQQFGGDMRELLLAELELRLLPILGLVEAFDEESLNEEPLDDENLGNEDLDNKNLEIEDQPLVSRTSLNEMNGLESSEQP